MLKKINLIFIQGLEAVKSLFTTQTFRDAGITMSQNQHPGCINNTFDSEGYWECYIRDTFQSNAHMTSTCSMGEVVDNRLRYVTTLLGN